MGFAGTDIFNTENADIYAAYKSAKMAQLP